MTAKALLLKNIDFKTLDFTAVTVEFKCGNMVINGPPTEPITAFPTGVRIQITEAELDYSKWIVTFNAKVDTTLWKNIRSAPFENPLALMMQMLNVNGVSIPNDLVWIDGAPRAERGISIYAMDSYASHEGEVATLKKTNSVIARIGLHLGGSNGGCFDEAVMKKNLNLYRDMVTKNTALERRGDMSEANAKRAADFLGIKFEN